MVVTRSKFLTTGYIIGTSLDLIIEKSASLQKLVVKLFFVCISLVFWLTYDSAAGRAWASNIDSPATRGEELERLEHGQVVVGLKEIGSVKYVVGKVLIDEPPNQVWPVLVNPFEFREKICPRMKDVKVLLDQARESVLQCRIVIGFFIPDITYIVHSDYTPLKRIEFHSIGGSLKKFTGVWELNPSADGKRTELAYWMDIDPGYPVPLWMVREAVKMDLPRTLNAVRRRVDEFRSPTCKPAEPSIVAASVERRQL